MEAVSICPQTIYKFDVPSDLIADALVQANDLEFAVNSQNFRTVSSHIFNQPNFAELKAYVDGCVQEVNEQVYGLAGIRVTQSWVNKAQPGMWHHLHTHANSLISGTIYLTDSEADTWFSMDNIWQPGRSQHTPILDLGNTINKSLSLVHKEKTTVGKLLLFPSTIWHSVGGNESNHERFTIAFNTFMTGTIGSEWELNELILT